MGNYIEAWELSKQLDDLIMDQADILRRSLKSQKSSNISVNYV